MNLRQRAVVITAVALVQGCAAFAQLHLPMEPRRDRGQSVIGAIEGWYQNPDGSYTELVGYYNRNKNESVDIPVGANNKIEPGGPDFGQPTHFFPGRAYGLFAVHLPKDFGNKKLMWSLTVGAETTSIPIDLNPLWECNPFSEIGMGNTPPWLGFSEGSAKTQGPAPSATTKTAKVGTPLPLDIWVTDDAMTFPGAKSPVTPAVAVSWSRFRGPAEPVFSAAKPAVEVNPAMVKPGQPFAGKSTTNVTFSEPGEYILNVTLNDWSGDGGRGFLCCWTDGQVKVTVTR